MQEEETSEIALKEDQDIGVEDVIEVSTAPRVDAETPTSVLTEYLPVDSTVMSKIMQSLQYSQLRKRITADPRNLATFHCDSMTSARAGFWAADLVHGSTTTSHASFFDIVFGSEGRQRLLLLSELRGAERPVLLAPQGVVEVPESSEARGATNANGEHHYGGGKCSTELSSASQRMVLLEQQHTSRDMDAQVQESGGETRHGGNPSQELSSVLATPSEMEQRSAFEKESQASTKETRFDANVIGTLPGEKSATKADAQVPGPTGPTTVPRDRANVLEASLGGKISAGLSSASIESALPESRALVPVKAQVNIPPIWVDVCKAIIVLQKENPEALAMLTAHADSRKFIAHTTTESQEVKPSAGGGGAHDETPRFLRESKEEQQPRVVSGAKPKKVAVPEDINCQPEEKKPRRHRTEQEKVDRRERKRQKKEKRERRKKKKAERKERKRKARDQNNSAAVLVEHRGASLSNFGPRQPFIAEQPSQYNQVYGTLDAGAKWEGKRRKIEKPRPVEKPSTGKVAAVGNAKVPPAEQQVSYRAHPAVQGGKVLGQSQYPAFGDRDKIPGKRMTSIEEDILNSNRVARNDFVDNGAELSDNPERPKEYKRRRKDKKRHRSGRPSHAMPTVSIMRSETTHHEMKPEASMGNGNAKENKATANRVGGSGDCKNLSAAGSVAGDVRCLKRDFSSPQDTTTAAPAFRDANRASIQDNDEPQLRALCSESFFEEWSEAIALLASGQWLSLCAQSEKTDDDTPPRLGPKIQLFDTTLLEEGGVDVELPGHAIIVHRLSSWETTENANAYAKLLVRLTALEVYKDIDVIICADTDITPALSVNMAFIQNAVMSQSGIKSKSPSFQVIAPSLLAPVVASSVLSTRTQGISTASFINASISDVRVQERAHFLRTIAPSLSVCGALLCLFCLSDNMQNEDDQTSRAFQCLMRSSATIDRQLLGNEKLFEVNASALRQLSLAISVSLSDNK